MIDPAGVPLDITNSNVFVSACTQTPAPQGIGVFQGPVQPYVFVTPKASTQAAITAEEAYFVFGFGAKGEAKPWVDEASLSIRTTTKSTLLSMAASIGVPAAKWKGVPFDKSSEVLNAVATSASPEKTIGILGAEIYDANRDKVSALAFRAYKQKHAYFPDSAATSAVVPDCAMKVTRSFEGGDLSLYTPAEPCGCFYESQVGKPGASCKACADDTTCGGGACRHGYCEAK